MTKLVFSLSWRGVTWRDVEVVANDGNDLRLIHLLEPFYCL